SLRNLLDIQSKLPGEQTRYNPEFYIAILKLCLLQTEPFQTTVANAITDQPMLIQRLIGALLEYESCGDVKSIFAEYSQRHAGLNLIVQTVNEFKHLRTKKRISAQGLQIRTIDKALETILQVVQEVTKARNQPTPLSNRQAALLCD